MTRVGEFTVRRRRLVLGLSMGFFLISGAFGARVMDSLTSGGFEDPNAQSSRALEFLKTELGEGEVDVAMLVEAKGGSVDDPAVADAGRALTQQITAERGVLEAYSYWTLGNAPPLRSENGRMATILVRFDGDRDFTIERLDELAPKYTMSTDLIEVRLSGYGAVFREVNKQIEKDLQRAEMIAIPITGILLLIVFRSAIASWLPLVIGGMAIVGTLFTLRVVTLFTEVSVFALNMTIAMSLGLAIDYALFVVSRFREERAAGHPTDVAVVRTVATAGRTVAFSAVTVAASLVALLVFPLSFLRSFGFAGIALVVLAGAGATITLPAILATLGPRIDRWSVRKPRSYEPGTGGWHRVATWVMRRPVRVALVGTAGLLVLGTPFLHMNLVMPDTRVLPEDAPARQTVEEFSRNFPGNEAFPIFVVARDVGDTEARRGDIESYAGRLSTVPGVARVDAFTGSYALGGRLFASPEVAAQFANRAHTYFRVVPAQSIFSLYSPRAEKLVEDLKAQVSPFANVALAGQAPSFIETRAAMFSRLPLALALIGVITFVVLFLAFGSVVVPLKAIVLNLLSLTATFGAMVWIFQDGHLASMLGATPREGIDLFNPILMFAIAFGISMDYEVFMLSRVKEEYDRTRDNVRAVAAGLERTGGIVTAAAVILAVVFLAQLSSQISIIKIFGLGLALAVLMDAFVVRSALVPAFMRLAGNANWWLPGPLRRLHDRFGFSERTDVDLSYVLSQDGQIAEEDMAVAVPARRKATTRSRKAATSRKPTARQAARGKRG